MKLHVVMMTNTQLKEREKEEPNWQSDRFREIIAVYETNFKTEAA
jgi:hypothetical protein